MQKWLILYAPTGSTITETSVSRALKHFDADHVVVVVLEQDDPWWRPVVDAIPPANVVVLPLDRGSGLGVLKALLDVFKRDPTAQLVIAPAGMDDVPIPSTPLAKGTSAYHAENGPVVVGSADAILKAYLQTVPFVVAELIDLQSSFEGAFVHQPWLALETVFPAHEEISAA